MPIIWRTHVHSAIITAATMPLLVTMWRRNNSRGTGCERRQRAENRGYSHVLDFRTRRLENTVIPPSVLRKDIDRRILTRSTLRNLRKANSRTTCAKTELWRSRAGWRLTLFALCIRGSTRELWVPPLCPKDEQSGPSQCANFRQLQRSAYFIVVHPNCASILFLCYFLPKTKFFLSHSGFYHSLV